MTSNNPTVVPAQRYRNAATATDWLCDASGFKKHVVVPGENRTISHAQLTHGSGMTTLGSHAESEFGRLMKMPNDIGGCETQSCYIIVSNVDSHYRQAKAAGATVVIDIKDEHYRGRGYTCRDLEGHIWSFGTYDPWRVSELATNDSWRHSRSSAVVIHENSVVAAITKEAPPHFLISGGVFAQLGVVLRVVVVTVLFIAKNVPGSC